METNDKNYLPIGTSFSGYIGNFTKPGQGSGCWNCIHLDREPIHCDHPVVKADWDVPHDEEDHAIVSLGGCCTYIRRKGDK